MNPDQVVRIAGILHPGAMGISVAATMQNSGQRVLWTSAGRSEQSRARAAEHGLVDAGSLAELCRQAQLLVSVCPPHAAEEVAEEAVAAGYQGLFLDANAISPGRAERIGQKLEAAGCTFVDGGIIGGPAWQPGRTWLYLSGREAERVSAVFTAGPLETAIIGPEIGAASALKMCFAAYTKGSTALLSAVLAAADGLGVREALERQWARRDADFSAETQARVRQVTAKAWRFAGEMDEIATTFAQVGVPDGFHNAAGELYGRLAGFKDAPETPELAEVLAAVRGVEYV